MTRAARTPRATRVGLRRSPPGRDRGGAPGAVILSGPEQPHQRVPAMKAPGRGQGKVGKQRDALRLRENRKDLFSLGSSEIQIAEYPELDQEPGLQQEETARSSPASHQEEQCAAVKEGARICGPG
jgi:hypothetical protein